MGNDNSSQKVQIILKDLTPSQVSSLMFAIEYTLGNIDNTVDLKQENCREKYKSQLTDLNIVQGRFYESLANNIAKSIQKEITKNNMDK